MLLLHALQGFGAVSTHCTAKVAYIATPATFAALSQWVGADACVRACVRACVPSESHHKLSDVQQVLSSHEDRISSWGFFLALTKKRRGCPHLSFFFLLLLLLQQHRAGSAVHEVGMLRVHEEEAVERERDGSKVPLAVAPGDAQQGVHP